MDLDFEPIDYATLKQTVNELEATVEQKAELARSVVAENAGLLLAVDDAIAMLIEFVGERGVPADQAEALPIVKALRQAINIPSTAVAIETLVQARASAHEKSLKEQISTSIRRHCGGDLPNCNEDIHQTDRFQIGAPSVLGDICDELGLYQTLEEGEAA